MSLAKFQAAMAALIRCPNPDRNPAWRELWPSVAELPPEQQSSLEALATHEELNKYGREQREQRWQTTWNKIMCLRWIFEEDFLHELWLDLFEPQHMTVPADVTTSEASYTSAFLAFLLHSPKAREHLDAENVPYVYDLITFEKAEIELAQYAVKSHPLPQDSVLAHGHIRLLELNYDVPNWLASLHQLPIDAPLPNPEVRKVLLLLVRSSPSQIPRVFEIDTATYEFLQGELGLGARQEVTTSLLADLTAMSLAPQNIVNLI